MSGRHRLDGDFAVLYILPHKPKHLWNKLFWGIAHEKQVQLAVGIKAFDEITNGQNGVRQSQTNIFVSQWDVC